MQSSEKSSTAGGSSAMSRRALEKIDAKPAFVRADSISARAGECMYIPPWSPS